MLDRPKGSAEGGINFGIGLTLTNMAELRKKCQYAYDVPHTWLLGYGGRYLHPKQGSEGFVEAGGEATKPPTLLWDRVKWNVAADVDDQDVIGVLVDECTFDIVFFVHLHQILIFQQ